jgi:hypothetical protein
MFAGRSGRPLTNGRSAGATGGRHGNVPARAMARFDKSPDGRSGQSDSEHPNRQDRRQSCQAANGPAGRVGRFVVTGAAHFVGPDGR